MIDHPFANLRPFTKQLDVLFLDKADNVATDADIKRVTGVATLTSLHQKHGKNVVVVREESSRTLPADGLVTDVKGLSLLIRFADCQNFVIYAPKHNVVGLIHAGWKGVVAGVIPEFFAVLKREWNIAPGEVMVGAGPSLCFQGADFTDPAAEVPTLKPFIGGRCVDLIAAANKQFADAGVPSANIERMPECTRCNPGTLWTYRGGHREEVKSGFTNCLVVTLR
ncbi:MAG TPA: polyphenol oxidase family protein [Candidatus Peribacteria bacterium]|nr:polyphenol oxidase family protein [Candidatus Peribacteria bacterium]